MLIHVDQDREGRLRFCTRCPDEDTSRRHKLEMWAALGVADQVTALEKIQRLTSAGAGQTDTKKDYPKMKIVKGTSTPCELRVESTNEILAVGTATRCAQIMEAVMGDFEDEISKVAELQDEVRRLKAENEALEALRPVWADGHSTSSAAEQVRGVALGQLWSMLGADSQIEAVKTLRRLLNRDTAGVYQGANASCDARPPSNPGKEELDAIERGL